MKIAEVCMKPLGKLLVMVSGIFVSVAALSQSCILPLEQSAPNARFEVDLADSGVVTDLRTGLSWQRCAAGMEIDDANTSILSDDRCELIDQNPQDGVADINDDDFNNDVELTYSWFTALEFAEQAGNGWRIPNLKELSSLVEYACSQPAINANVFPDTAQDNYWTTTPNARIDSSIWVIDFSTGADDSIVKNSSGFVLLVRD